MRGIGGTKSGCGRDRLADSLKTIVEFESFSGGQIWRMYSMRIGRYPDGKRPAHVKAGATEACRLQANLRSL